MYQMAKSKIDHVTHKATGVKMTEYWSNFKLTLISKVTVFVHCQLVEMVSNPWSKNRNNGRRLTKNDICTAFLTWVQVQPSFKGEGLIDVTTG